MLGQNWRVMRGDWRIENGRLRVTRAWPSDNIMVCALPMPRGDARAVVRFRLEPTCSLQMALRAGEHYWGAGGLPDAVSVKFRAAAGPASVRLAGGEIEVAPDVDYTAELTLIGPEAAVRVNGAQVADFPAAPERSEVNRSLYINCMANGWVDSIAVYSRPDAETALPLAANTPDENRAATVHAGKFIDPANPAPWIQKAIDSLPANGGGVILPAGEFLMRRHLALRSGVALRGQGFDKTILRHAPIRQTKVLRQEQGGLECRVTVEDASLFRVGDALCFGEQWEHVAGSDPNLPGRNHVVTAIAGNVLAVSGRVPEKSASVKNFFPLVFCIATEFAEVSDLTLRGPESGPGGGGFNTCPVSFGCVYGARIHRVNVEGFPADGISVQGAGDAFVTDNTVTSAAQGFHPGTRTQRFLWARNRSVGNASGLFFCFSNENGVYGGNVTDDFTGYPLVGDNFNVLSGNVSLRPLQISSGGYAGLIFNNRLPAIETASSDAEPGFPRYFGAPSYYLLCENRLDRLVFGKGTEAIVAVGNVGPHGPAPAEGMSDRIVCSDETPGLAGKAGLEAGAGRETPVGPPLLPKPVMDGMNLHDPAKPDAGFQAALDRLAATGGTLQLPAGRYALKTALKVPAKVTLAGYGAATVLHASEDYEGAMLVCDNAEGVTIRDLSILGRYAMAERAAPAIDLRATAGTAICDVDIRGWGGIGIRASGRDTRVMNCRVIGAGGIGYMLEGGVRLETSLARECAAGIRLSRAAPGSRIEASIASANRGNGLTVAGGEKVRILSNNIHFNFDNGILLDGVAGGFVLGNLVRANNQRLDHCAGIRLKESSGMTVAYNHCSDDQIHASQPTGLLEDAGSGGNAIIGNLLAPFHQPYHFEDIPALISRGKGSRASANLIRSAWPTGCSIEWHAMGFEGTPQSHERDAATVRENSNRAISTREALRTRPDATPAQIAEAEAAIEKSMLAQKAFDRKRTVRQAKLRVMMLELEKAPATAVAEARKAVFDAEKQMADIGNESRREK